MAGTQYNETMAENVARGAVNFNGSSYSTHFEMGQDGVTLNGHKLNGGDAELVLDTNQ